MSKIDAKLFIISFSTIPIYIEQGEITSSKALKRLFDEGISTKNISFSSHGQGSLPDFNEKGEIKIGNDGDLVLVDKHDLSIDTVITKGQIMIENKNILVKSTF